MTGAGELDVDDEPVELKDPDDPLDVEERWCLSLSSESPWPSAPPRRQRRRLPACEPRRVCGWRRTIHRAVTAVVVRWPIAMELRLENAEEISAQPHREVHLLAESPEVSVTWSRYAPGERGPDPHVHREHFDAFYVLEGELTFVVGPAAERITAMPGGIVAVPPNVIHSFVNDGNVDACWLNMHAPDTGFAHYLRDLRDGRRPHFDSFDPPDDGGRPVSDVVVTERHLVVLPELSIAERNGVPGDEEVLPGRVRHTFATTSAGQERFVEIIAPGAAR